MAVLMRLMFLACAISAAATVTAAPVPFVLNNVASGVHTGLPNSVDGEKNRVVYAKEAVMPDGTIEVQILRADDGLSPSSSAKYATSPATSFTTALPFTGFACEEGSAGKKTPVLVYSKTSMAEVVVGTPLRIYFVCATAANSAKAKSSGVSSAAYGTLYTSTSFDLGESWDQPTALTFGTNGAEVLLKGMGPMISSYNDPSTWLLPAMTASCSLTFVALKANGAAVNEETSLTFCADKGTLQVSSAGWMRAPSAEAAVPADNNRLVLMALMGDVNNVSAPLQPLALACSLNLMDCSDKASWTDYTPSTLGNKGTTAMDAIPTGDAPSVFTAASYSSTAPKPAADCISTLPQLFLASETRITSTNTDTNVSTTGSYLGFQMSRNVTALMMEGSEGRALIGAIMGGQPNVGATAPTAQQISGVAIVPLPYSRNAADECVEHWGFLVSVVSNSTKQPPFIVGSFTNAAFDPNSNGGGGADGGKSDDEGQPALAAAITFIIIGAVIVVLGAIFLVGFIRNRKNKDIYDAVPNEHVH